jgi:hypothetical protein
MALLKRTVLASCAAALAVLAATACDDAPVHPKPPANFAVAESSTRDGEDLVALAPNGVVYRVHHEANEPAADLAFWRKALETHLTDTGYQILERRDVQLAGHAGFLVEAAIARGDGDGSYLVAFAPIGKQLVVVDAGGPRKAFGAVKGAVNEAIEKGL